MTDTTFVPVALKMDEAEAAFNACQVAFDHLGKFGHLTDPPAGVAPLIDIQEVRGRYARAMVSLADAIDRARETS